MAAWALILMLTGCAATHWTVAPGQHGQSFAASVRHDVRGQFLLYMPSDYRAHGSTRYPLLIFLHGSGESGTDLQQVKAHGPPQFLDQGKNLPFIVVSPQALNEDHGFDLDALNWLLDELLRRLPVDPDRVYLTGLSMGGIETYEWAAQHPERFAAIAPVAGNGDPATACRLRALPLWAFHGAKDEVVSPQADSDMVSAVKACGGDARLTLYPDVGHESWERAYDDPALYAWLLSHRRSVH